MMMSVLSIDYYSSAKSPNVTSMRPGDRDFVAVLVAAEERDLGDRRDDELSRQAHAGCAAAARACLMPDEIEGRHLRRRQRGMVTVTAAVEAVRHVHAGRVAAVGAAKVDAVAGQRDRIQRRRAAPVRRILHPTRIVCSRRR